MDNTFEKIESTSSEENDSSSSEESLDDINSYIKNRLENEIQRIQQGENKEIEKRYQRYIDYG